MAWSIVQVARMSKVTSRTLRHYDDIGLLPPAYVGGNGYRYYQQEQLLRLQEILLLRQLGLGLDTIGEIVHQGRDRVAALRRHQRELLAERDRFQRLADTVAATIEDLEGGEQEMVKVDHWFEGLDSQTQQRYEAEAAERWGADDPRFRKNFDKTHPRLAEFLRSAMTSYAEARLS